MENTSLAAQGALAHRLQRRNICNVAPPATLHRLQNPKWPPGGPKMADGVVFHQRLSSTEGLFHQVKSMCTEIYFLLVDFDDILLVLLVILIVVTERKQSQLQVCTYHRSLTKDV